MPIRLVVAVAVGVAAFGLLVPMADRVEQSTETEVTVEPDSTQVALDSTESSEVTVHVVTSDGQPVDDATVLVSGRSLPVEGDPIPFETGPEGNAVTFSIGTDSTADVPVTFRPTQGRGTLRLRVVPPSDGSYADDLDNPELTINRS